MKNASKFMAFARNKIDNRMLFIYNNNTAIKGDDHKMSNHPTKLHIVQYCDNYFPQIDGVVKVVHNSSRYLNEWEECKVIVPGYSKHPYDDSVFSYEVLRRPTTTFTFNKFEIPLPRNKRSITEAVEAFHPDIFHAHSPFFLGHYALKLAKKNHVPLVATFHSQFKKDILATTHSKLLTKWILRYIVHFFNQCDEVWAPSKKSAETLRSYGYKKDVFVMENGTDFKAPDDLEEVEKNAIEAFSIDKKNKNLLYVGQLRYVKNIKLIFQTMQELIREDNSYQLYLAGEGCDEPSMRDYVRKNHLEEHVHFVGQIADIRLLQGLYSVCDLFFFPSTYDTFAIVVREACVMKLPSLLTIDSNTAEPFQDGVNGFLAKDTVEDMKAKIIEIFSDDEKRKKVGKYASETMPISFEQMAKATRNRYQIVIENYKQKQSKK